MHSKDLPVGLKTIDPSNIDGLNSALKNTTRSKKTEVTLQKLLVDKDILERMRYAYAINPPSFQIRFAKLGVIINSEKDLIPLANLAATGMDVKGIRGSDGHFHAFTTEEIIEGIRVNQESYGNSGINYKDLVLHQGFVKKINT